MKLFWYTNKEIQKNIKKQLLKTQASFIICLHSGNLLE